MPTSSPTPRPLPSRGAFVGSPGGGGGPGSGHERNEVELPSAPSPATLSEQREHPAQLRGYTRQSIPEVTPMKEAVILTK